MQQYKLERILIQKTRKIKLATTILIFRRNDYLILKCLKVKLRIAVNLMIKDM